ncbi:MAG TPA: hypothetical protein VF487_04340 [Chitinophagaceae bacterium]
MKYQLLHINNKINAIQTGLLRFHGKSIRTSMPVKVVTGDGGVLNCMLSGDRPSAKLINKKVSLIQRYNDDYLYVSGKVFFVGEHDLVSIHIAKAFWFIRKVKGRVTWLENKCIYENAERNIA